MWKLDFNNKLLLKLSRPSYLPFWGVVNFERRIPLARAMDIIIEQGIIYLQLSFIQDFQKGRYVISQNSFLLGWLQAIFGIHTFRLESVAQGKASYVDELQIQGVSNPEVLRKVNINASLRSYFSFFIIFLIKSCMGKVVE